jgi:hypothetical protein
MLEVASLHSRIVAEGRTAVLLPGGELIIDQSPKLVPSSKQKLTCMPTPQQKTTAKRKLISPFVQIKIIPDGEQVSKPDKFRIRRY